MPDTPGNSRINVGNLSQTFANSNISQFNVYPERDSLHEGLEVLAARLRSVEVANLPASIQTSFDEAVEAILVEADSEVPDQGKLKSAVGTVRSVAVGATGSAVWSTIVVAADKVIQLLS